MIAGQQGRGGIWRQKWKLLFLECYKDMDEIKFIFIESLFQNVNEVFLGDRYIFIPFSLNLNIVSLIIFAFKLTICDEI